MLNFCLYTVQRCRPLTKLQAAVPVTKNTILDGRHCSDMLVLCRHSTGVSTSSVRHNRYASHLTPIICDIFQSSVNSGQVPKAWKEANITAIFKKGNRAETSNYRPISLTTVISKLLEHIIHSHIMKHLEQHHILTDHQHGFCAKRSTETQLIQTVHDISKSLDEKKSVDMAILDFTKAFDIVPHKRLIHKLKYYGITGPIS